MRLKILVIAMMIPLIYGDENGTTTPTTTTASTSSSSTSEATTQVPSTTTTTTVAPKTENSTASPAKSPSNRIQHLNTTSYACSCDLTLNCDVNCCCDMDCSDGILQAFKCDDGVEIDDYHHGEGLERCTVNSGLLCVMKSNLDDTDDYMKASALGTYTTHRWPKPSSTDLEPSHDIVREFYKYDDSILVYDKKAEKVETIKIPAAFNEACYLSEPITFLNSKNIKCLRTVNELCEFNSIFIQQLLNFQLFRRPSKLTEAKEAADVFSINLESCKHSYINCTRISVGEVAEEMTGDEMFDEIRLEFFINDTKIENATIKFFSRDDMICGEGDFGPTKVVQSFDVKFTNIQDNQEKKIRSKSRGYKSGEMIIASRYRPINESAPENDKIFDYFRNGTYAKMDYHMKLPENRDGRCVLNEVHDLIRFNENSQTLCKVELERDERLNDTTCQQFQRQLVQFLFSTLNLTANYTKESFVSDVFVSKLWSPNYDLTSWIRIEVKNPPTWSPEEKDGVCMNMPSSISYLFFTSTQRVKGVRKYEHKIDKLEIEFGYLEELQLQTTDENQTLAVDIQVQVQFLSKKSGNHASNSKLSLSLIFMSSFISFFCSFN